MSNCNRPSGGKIENWIRCSYPMKTNCWYCAQHNNVFWIFTERLFLYQWCEFNFTIYFVIVEFLGMNISFLIKRYWRKTYANEYNWKWQQKYRLMRLAKLKPVLDTAINLIITCTIVQQMHYLHTITYWNCVLHDQCCIVLYVKGVTEVSNRETYIFWMSNLWVAN